MRRSLAQKVVIILLTLSLFSCGELETLLPSKGSYQVKTLVNGNSLETCSIIRSTDEILPYFAISVEDDPDLVGLLMYLQDSRGEIVGEKVRYIIEAYANEPEPEETIAQEAAAPPETDADNEAVNESNESGEAENSAEETEQTPENTVAEAEEAEPAEAPSDRRIRSSTNTKIKENSLAIEIVVASLNDLEPFPLPIDTEPQSCILVFEALGKKEILSRTETNVFYLANAEFNLKDVTMYLPWLSDFQLIAPGTTVLLETRVDFDSRLDPYVIWYNGKNIISEGKFSDGAASILWTAPAQVAPYSLRSEVFPLQPKRNLAGFSREINLQVSPSPKAVNIGYFFENASNLTARSPLTEGTVYPEQAQLVAELIAEMALIKTPANSGDKDDEDAAPVPPSPPELLRWYQFDGSLHDSKAPLVDEQSLVPISKKRTRWASAKQSYGLSTEANDAYQTSAINFFQKEQDQGGGIFLFHIKPSTEGVIFNTFFPLLASENDGAWMDMIRDNNTIVLRLNAENTIAEIPVYLDPFEAQGLIPIVVEFYILPHRLEAKISVGENLHSNAGKVTLSGALKGEGKIRLGGKNNAALAAAQTSVIFKSANSLKDIPVEETDIDTDTDTAEPQPQTVHQANTIWDEFAILFSSVPLSEEEFIEEVIEAEEIKPETKAPEAEQNKEAQKVTSSTDDEAEFGGEEPISPEADINSIQERETVVILPEDN